MDQYRPANYASKYPEINRCITSEEYSEALRFAFKVGLRRIAGLRTAFV
jgi:putative pyruvate formate lyase activating enzyme